MSVKIENIFCPVDLRTENAVDLIQPLTLAGRMRGKIFFCYCLPPAAGTALDAVRRHLHQLVVKALSLASSSGEMPADWEAIVIESADCAATIVAQSAARKIDLIALRSRHSPPIKSLLLGSVAETLSRIAPCSVLITRTARPSTANAPRRAAFRRILTAYDFSDYSELALQHAALLCEKYDAPLSLLHVLPEPQREEPEMLWTDEITSQLYHQTVKRLQTVLAAETPVIKQATAAVRWGRSYSEILTYADENQIDLIAMGAHGADFGARSLFGSNVDRVLRQASQAVLIARPLKPSTTRRLRKISRSYA